MSVEFFIDAFVEWTLIDRTTVKIGDFVDSFAGTSGIPKAMSPFTAPDYEEILDRTAMLKLLEEK
ncbi:MAG: hypothetical protein ABJQ34_19010 [Paracoccaceae bacterium]